MTSNFHSSRNGSLTKLQKYGQTTKVLKSAIDGIKYVGKIKLIKRDNTEDEKLQKSKKENTLQQKDLSGEFNYLNEMDESVADRLNKFKSKEQENKVAVVNKRGSRNKSPPKDEPAYIQRERDMTDEVERIFQQHKNGFINNNSSKSALINDFVSSSPNQSRPHSDDSGLVDEERSGTSSSDLTETDKERLEMDEAEEMFRNFTLQHKQSQSRSHSKRQEKNGLLVRLELAEKRAEAAKESMRVCKLNKSFEDSLDAEESYHTTALEISRLKKQLLTMDTVKRITNQVSGENNNAKLSITAGITRSRECKFATQHDHQPVDKSLYNEDGDCVPEGITNHRIKVFQA